MKEDTSRIISGMNDPTTDAYTCTGFVVGMPNVAPRRTPTTYTRDHPGHVGVALNHKSVSCWQGHFGVV